MCVSERVVCYPGKYICVNEILMCHHVLPGNYRCVSPRAVHY